jgi:N-acetylneuraminic acid mutarotase
MKCADLPVPVSHPGIAALDGMVYVLSGYTGGSYSEQGVTNRCFRYSPAVDSWEEIASLPVAACAPGVVTWKGKIYVFGGDTNKQFDNAGNCTVYEYSPGNDSWKLVNDKMPHGRMHIGAGRIGSKVYLSPGRPGRVARSKDDVVQEFDLEKMDQGEKAWRLMNNLPEDPRTGYISSWPVVNGKLYYICGETPVALSSVHVFTPDEEGGTWKRLPDFPTPLHGVGPIAVGGKIYVCGGAAGGGISMKTDNVWVLSVSETP